MTAAIRIAAFREYNDRMPQIPMVDLVAVGLNATDTLLCLAEFPARGSKIEYADALVLPGGQAATTAVACQSWGLRTRYVGKLGDDEAARLHRSQFARVGVDARLIEVKDAPSPQSLILVDGGGERTVLCRRDERLLLQPAEIKREWVVSARALHVDGYETAAAIQAARWAREAGIPVIADLDETYESVEDLIRHVDYLVVSRDFPKRLTGEPNLARALQVLSENYGCRLSAATLGDAGVLAWDGERLLHRPAYSVNVVDTTGAGDVFHAGFIYGLLQGWALERQLDFACAAAALNCTRQGARGGIRSVEDVEELMATAATVDDPHLPIQCALEVEDAK
ncbi:MAG: carbohydrate kinase family protein [Acidobacteriota bacterium]